MPDASDPSFAREERRARARRAAADASEERQQELRSKYAPPPPAARSRAAGAASGSGSGSPKRGRRPDPVIDADAVAASARAALDAHPSTWTSYAELCAANGLDRGLASVAARQLGPQLMGEHWFRIRDAEGVYNVPADKVTPGDRGRFSQAEADRALEALGVRMRARHADPERRLLWMHGEWCLAGR